MSKITAVFDPEADGTVHLPIPEELRSGRVRVTAILEPAIGSTPTQPTASAEMLRRRREAFEKLRQLNPFRGMNDPVTWQKEVRAKRVLPGRE